MRRYVHVLISDIFTHRYMVHVEVAVVVRNSSTLYHKVFDSMNI